MVPSSSARNVTIVGRRDFDPVLLVLRSMPPYSRSDRLNSLPILEQILEAARRRERTKCKMLSWPNQRTGKEGLFRTVFSKI